jgi:hypothetical protein
MIELLTRFVYQIETHLLEGDFMKRISLRKVNLDILKAATASLALLLLLLAPARAQEKHGRMVNPAQLIEAQRSLETRTIELDADAAEALARALGAGQLKGQIASFFNIHTLRFDVSENAKRFVFDETPLHADGTPAYGNEFVTEGYIYPEGTLSNTNGVKEDGSPEFPNKVIGRWTCRGWHVGEGAKTVTGPWVVTHQYFDLGPVPGQSSLTTDGLELVDIDKPVLRAIIGGTGAFAQARGEARQTMIGFNQLNGVNLRLEIKVVMR